MSETGPSSGVRPSSMGSMPSTYQRTPSIARSTSARADRHGLPISQTSRRASSSRLAVRASRVAATRARRSGRGTWRQARCRSSAARTAAFAVAPSSRGGPAIGRPSTGLVAGRTRPSALQPESQRLSTRSSRNASGATARQRRQASVQDVPDLRTRGPWRGEGAPGVGSGIVVMRVSALGARSGAGSPDPAGRQAARAGANSRHMDKPSRLQSVMCSRVPSCAHGTSAYARSVGMREELGRARGAPACARGVGARTDHRRTHEASVCVQTIGVRQAHRRTRQASKVRRRPPGATPVTGGRRPAGPPVPPAVPGPGAPSPSGSRRPVLPPPPGPSSWPGRCPRSRRRWLRRGPSSGPRGR